MIAVIFPKKHQIHTLIRRMELKYFKHNHQFKLYKTKKQNEVVFIECGTGRERAEFITEKIIEEFNPKLIISVGYCEGVKSTITLNQLVLCKNLYTLNGVPAGWSPKDFEAPIKSNKKILDLLSKGLNQFDMRYAIVDCLSLPWPESQVELKKWLGINFPVEIIDIAAYPVGKMAIKHGVPFLILRTVLSTVDNSMPKFVSKIFESEGRSIIKAIVYIMANPFRGLELFRLSNQSNQHQRLLSQALDEILLCFKDSAKELGYF